VTSALLLAALLATDPASPATSTSPAATPTVPPGSAAAVDPLAAPAPAVLTLADALAELDRRSPTLSQARARADEASALSRQVLAPLLPQLTATGGLVHNNDQVKTPTIPGLTTGILIQPYDQISVGASLRIPLLMPSAWFDLAASRAAARGSAEQASATRLALRAALVTQAHLAVAVEEAVAAAERSLASARELASSAGRRVQAGTAAPLDALRAATEQVKREGDLVRSRADLERMQLALGVLLGRDQPVRVLVPPPAAPAPATPEALVAEALGGRPELRAQALQVSAAQEQLRSAWARLAPTLSISGSVFAADVPYPTGEKQGWKTTVDLTWLLYDGGLRYGKRSEAEARLASASATEEAQRLAISQETRDAAREVVVAAERLRLAGEQRRLAAEAAGSAQRTYELGVASSLDVVDANDRRYAADIGLAEAQARLAGARVALEHALGRGP
jgi:outer membrane protein TolC